MALVQEFLILFELKQRIIQPLYSPSLMQNEIDTLKEENQMIMLAIAELAESSDTVETV